MKFLRMTDLDLAGRRVLIREDRNVPIEDGRITSTQRLDAALPTLRAALAAGATVLVMSHLGRPKEGVFDAAESLAPVAAWLSQALGRDVPLVRDYLDGVAVAPGGIVLLENCRMNVGEAKDDPALAAKYAALCDVFVMDAFGTAHRAHASTVGIIEFLKPAAAGLLMEKELEYLEKCTKNPERPCIGILGGAKVSDKIEVIENLLKFADRLLIGGAMAYTFLKSQGKPVGRSLVEDDKLELAKGLLEKAGDRILLPCDHVVAEVLEENAPCEVVDEIPEGKMGLDIGPKTREAYAEVIRSAKTIIWNGPMGVFEKKPFDEGTVAIAKAVAESGALSVVGGGDSEKAVKAAGVADRISHISTGGGASLEYLAGLTLPGVAALTDKQFSGNSPGGAEIPPGSTG
jgi:phosphoglycerate kinase